MRDRASERVRFGCAFAALFVTAALACSPPAPRFDAGFRGPGRLVLIFEPTDPEIPRALVVHDASGARELPVERPRNARWLNEHELLVSRETPSEEPYGLPNTELLRVNVSSGRTHPVAEPARWFDAEPDPKGERIAVGLEVDDQGESDLLVLASDAPGAKPLAGRNQPLDRPRWSPDGASLVVLQTLPDADGEDSETGLSVAGQVVSWPRMFRAAGGLRGPLFALRDGEPNSPMAAGGSLPLFWSPRGIFARQRRGLVRCDPEGSGCALVWAPGGAKRVVDARPAGGDFAFALVRDHASPSELDLPRELYRVDLARGEALLLYEPPPELFLAEIDWVGGP